MNIVPIQAETIKPETPRDLEKLLRDAGFSSRQAKLVVAGGLRVMLAWGDVDPLDDVIERISALGIGQQIDAGPE